MIILDGGLGRELQRIGAPFGQPEWSAKALFDGPKFVRQAHDSFIAAGADVITTNSYAIVPHHIGQDRYDSDAGRLLQLSATLARDAAAGADRQVRVAASIPPMFGSYVPDAFEPKTGQVMMKQFRAALAPVADIFIGETMGSIAEIRSYLEVFVDCAADLWVSATLEDVEVTPGVPRLRSGESVADLITALAGLRLDAMLFNCSQPEVMNDAIVVTADMTKRHAAAHGRPAPLIGVYANAFPLMTESYEGSNSTVHELRVDITPERYTRYAMEWRDSGASIIGGCCGITPTHIAHLAANLRATET